MCRIGRACVIKGAHMKVAFSPSLATMSSGAIVGSGLEEEERGERRETHCHQRNGK